MKSLNASFIVFYQFDHPDRERNLNILVDFINKNYIDFEIVVVQQYKSAEQRNQLPTPDFLKRDYIKHIIIDEDNRFFNKLNGYNIGAKNAKHNILIFNDVDVIFGPENVIECVDKVVENKNFLFQPNDPHVIDVKPHAIEIFKKELTYECLKNFIGKHYGELGRENSNVKILNVGSTGGGLIVDKGTLFTNLKGFNPNFRGWGFEDDETMHRFEKLGYPIKRMVGFKPMFHLYHREARRTPGNENIFWDDNKNLKEKIIKMPKEELIEYMKTWNN